jgi:hypothetical protein
MPKQKDLKRIVRSRMQKTGESYTAARLQVLKKNDADLAERAGISNAAIQKATGRSWSEWVRILDNASATSKPHREIVEYVHSQGGISSWWGQSVTVGYERIRGLREKGQRRGGGYEAHKSRTFAVPVKKLFAEFKKFAANFDVRSTTTNKRMRIAWSDDTAVEILFMPKGEKKSVLVVTHQKLPDKPAVEKMKSWWGEQFDALASLFQ